MSSSEAPDCGDLNSTECLLRAATSILAEVKKSGEEYNWDPLSFAATLVIGLVALFFAALTIGQAVLVAGPGRTKCSKYAIGPWAQLAERRVEWYELRFQSIAYTPVINIPRVLRHSWLDKEGWDSELDKVTAERLEHWDSGPKSMKLKYRPKSLNDYFPATWLSLLTYLGMDHPALWELKPAGTDYIPPELAAAPAYASIRDMVSLFALASFPHRVQLLTAEVSNKLLGIQGKHFDLDFRQHPALGMHAVFQTFKSLEPHQRWATKGEYFAKHGIDQLALKVLLHANGYLPQHKLMGNKLNTAIDRSMYPLSSYQYMNKRAKATQDRLRMLLEECKCFESPRATSCCGITDVPWHSWCFLSDKNYSLGPLGEIDIDRGGLELLAAEVPDLNPTLFPRRAMQIYAKIEGLLPLSRLWALREAPWIKTREEANGQPGDIPRGGLENLLVTPSEPIGAQRTQPSFRAHQVPFNMCRHYVSRVLGSFPSVDLDIIQLPGAIDETRWEIARVDEWLEKNVVSSAVKCRWLSLSYATAVQPLVMLYSEPWAPENIDEDEWMFMEDPQRPPQQVASQLIEFVTEKVGSTIHTMVERTSNFRAWQKAHHGDSKSIVRFIFGPLRTEDMPSQELLGKTIQELYKFIKLWQVDEVEGTPGTFTFPTSEVQHPLDDLLIYRAILVAVLFSAAGDNSDIIEDEASQKIIPIL